MSKGLPRSLSRGDKLKQDVVKEDIRISDLALSLTDPGAAAGYGSAVIADFPQGNILFLGATAYLTFTTADADIADTWEGDMAIGTTANADSTLSGTEVDLIASTAIAAATSKVSPETRSASSATENGAMFDNTDGSLELNLNLLVDNADVAGAADFTVDGRLHLAYIVLGDD